MSAAPAGLGRPLRVGLYARVSMWDRDQDPELQLDAMRDYVRARGWEASEYVDTAAAGDLTRRTSQARPVGTRAARSDQSGDRWRWLLGLGASDLVGASGFEPPGPTTRIIVPDRITEALRDVA